MPPHPDWVKCRDRFCHLGGRVWAWYDPPLPWLLRGDPTALTPFGKRMLVRRRKLYIALHLAPFGAYLLLRYAFWRIFGLPLAIVFELALTPVYLGQWCLTHVYRALSDAWGDLRGAPARAWSDGAEAGALLRGAVGGALTALGCNLGWAREHLTEGCLATLVAAARWTLRGLTRAAAAAVVRALIAAVVVAVGVALAPDTLPYPSRAHMRPWAPLIVWAWLLTPALSGAGWWHTQGGAGGAEVRRVRRFQFYWALSLLGWAAWGGGGALGSLLTWIVFSVPFRRFNLAHGVDLGLFGTTREVLSDSYPPPGPGQWWFSPLPEAGFL